MRKRAFSVLLLLGMVCGETACASKTGRLHANIDELGGLHALAEKGNMEAQYNLGVAYFNGIGVEQNEAHAVLLWRKVARQGHVEAQYNLGFAYATGNGVPRDLFEAVYWWREAARQGDRKARIALDRLNRSSR